MPESSGICDEEPDSQPVSSGVGDPVYYWIKCERLATERVWFFAVQDGCEHSQRSLNLALTFARRSASSKDALLSRMLSFKSTVQYLDSDECFEVIL